MEVLCLVIQCVVVLVSALSNVKGQACSLLGGQCPVPLALPLFCPHHARSSCRSDHQCPGDQRCCSDGCVHHCLPVCAATCAEGAVCRLHRRCTLPGCPPPVARCVTPDDSTLQIDCSTVDCPGECEDTDQGPVCSKSGQCPSNDIRPLLLNSVAVEGIGAASHLSGFGSADGGGRGRGGVFTLGQNTCASDFMCPHHFKCCDYGVGRKCVPACRRRCADGQVCRLKAVTTFCRRPPCFNFNRAVCDSSSTGAAKVDQAPKGGELSITVAADNPPRGNSLADLMLNLELNGLGSVDGSAQLSASLPAAPMIPTGTTSQVPVRQSPSPPPSPPDAAPPPSAAAAAAVPNTPASSAPASSSTLTVSTTSPQTVATSTSSDSAMFTTTSDVTEAMTPAASTDVVTANEDRTPSSTSTIITSQSSSAAPTSINSEVTLQ